MLVRRTRDLEAGQEPKVKNTKKAEGVKHVL